MKQICLTGPLQGETGYEPAGYLSECSARYMRLGVGEMVYTHKE